jgi:AcrR family transcriptional regulator
MPGNTVKPNFAEPASADRRTARTRTAIVDAYNHLVMHRRQDSIRVSDIVARANIGRSTFYEHYAGADAVFMEAVARPLALLADAAAGFVGPERLTPLLQHFWDSRQRTREMLAGRQNERISRLLADLVEARLRADTPFLIPTRLVSLQLSEIAMAPIRGWLTAEAPCPPEALAHAICAASAATLAALTVPRGARLPDR